MCRIPMLGCELVSLRSSECRDVVTYTDAPVFNVKRVCREGTCRIAEVLKADLEDN